MRNYLIGLSLGTYLLSWFTKVHHAQKGAWFSLIYGWEAFRVGLGPIWPSLNAVTSWSEGKPSESGYSLLMTIIPSFLSVPSSFTNGWMVLFGLACLTKKVESWRPVLFSGFVFCFCLNLFWWLSPLGVGPQVKHISGLRPGYFLWNLSFALTAVSLLPQGETGLTWLTQIFRKIVIPATGVSLLFAGYFHYIDLERRFAKSEESRKEEKEAKARPDLRKLSWAELTPIPAKTEKLSTPFLVEIEKQIQASPSDPSPWLERAYLQATWGNEARCREDFQKALSLSTNKPSVYWSLGWALLNLGRFQEAEEAWTKAWTPVAGEPEPRWVPSAMAMACWKSGNKNQALAWYQRAAEREPESFTTLEGLKERTSNWNTKEQNWLIEVYDVWNRTYDGRNSGGNLRKRLSGQTNPSSCSTCR